MNLTWTCPGCRRTFSKLPMQYSIAAPRAWSALPEQERAQRAQLTDDLCTIDNRDHYVRGCIELKVHDVAEPFIWQVWVAISDKSRRRIVALWSRPIPKKEPPQPGILNTWLGAFPEPDGIRCRVHVRSGDLRPLVELELSDYPLSIEQRTGITLERVKEIATKMGHV